MGYFYGMDGTSYPLGSFLFKLMALESQGATTSKEHNQVCLYPFDSY